MPQTNKTRLALKGIILVLILSALSSKTALAQNQGGGEETMSLTIKSPAFENNSKIPSQYTCEGSDMSPALEWSEPPGGTKSFALISDDPDAPVGTWVHWVIYNIPSNARALGENVPKKEILPDGSKQGITDFRRVGYGGPCPPPGPTHRYFFKLYALDTAPDLAPKQTKQQLEKAMQGHILAKAELIGLYKR